MKMELDFETILDVALGGPEIGPLNLSILHGLLREVFQKFDLSKRSFLVEKEDPYFSDAYNFIKSKVDETKSRPRTAGGGYSRDRSKVSVIVSDYLRSPVGGGQNAETKKSSLLPADIEDRLRYIESELKIVKDFPSVDELRGWAQEKTSPDTVVTDLWHFVSLNHRMGGAEEGIQKLTELVDKLLPELKRLGDGQNRIQGQVDDLYSQLKALSERTTRLDSRIDNAGNKAVEKVEIITNELRALEDKLSGFAKIMDLEGFVTMEMFDEAQEKAKQTVSQINDILDTKASMSMLDDTVSQDELKQLQDWVNTLRAQMETVASKDDLLHLDLYVKWPQLEDALTSSSRPGSHSSYHPESQSSSRKGSQSSSRKESPSGSNGHPGSCHSQNSTFSNHERTTSKKRYPSDTCLQKLYDLGMLTERQAALMDALDSVRDQLDDKANKTDLNGFLTQDDLRDLLNLVRDLREEVNGLQQWREIVDDEKVPTLRALLDDLEKQTSDMLNTLHNLRDEDQRKQKSIDDLFTYIDRLEENKLEKDDPILNSISSKTDDLDLENLVSRDRFDDAFVRLNDMLQKLLDRFNDHEDFAKKNITDILNDLNDKLDRTELQPLREYLENRYNVLSEKQQQQQPGQQMQQEETVQPPKSSKRHSPHSAKHNKPTSQNHNSNNGTKSPSNGYSLSVSHTVPSVNNDTRHTPSNSNYVPTKHALTYSASTDNLGCSHPHYGEGNFIPAPKEAAAFRTQMKFNCLSCDRPLTMNSNSYLQTIRSKPLNAYELDQLRLLQRILKGDKPGKPTRACGGRHTSTNPRITARINSNTSLPYMDDSDLLIDGEVDIEGLDGRLYRGLVSQKDLKNHSHSKSAIAQLRTVSPRPRSAKDRPISGKSAEFTSSMSSGLGTTYDSIDIQIKE